MTYGMRVKASNGNANLADMGTLRIVRTLRRTSSSGSVSIPQFDSSRGFFYVIPNMMAPILPNFSWDNVGKVMTWSTVSGFAASAWVNDFTILCVHTE